MTPAQLTTLKTAIFASVDPAVIAARSPGNDVELARLYNLPSTFVCWKLPIPTASIGAAVRYEAVGAMTSANTGRITLFYAMNPTTTDPSRDDVRAFFADTFSGALAGQGQNTRDALDALWRRVVTEAEKVFATGTGTTLAPGTLGSFTGTLTAQDVSDALARG